jgi:RNA polymerase sigma-70 factor (ECF subfamily)
VDENENLIACDVEGLVRKSVSGDRNAFDELVRRNSRRAMQLAVRILASADDAAEAVQDAFMKAFMSIHRIKDPKRFEVWLLKIVSNVSISRLRSIRRRRQIRPAEFDKNSKENTPPETAAGMELAKAIQKAMAKLPEKQAKVISLFGLQDLSQDEAAEIMGCSVEAVRWNVFEARKKLKELLKDYL